MVLRHQLFPWRLVVGLHLACIFVVVVFSAMAMVEDGPVQPAAWGVATAALLVWVAAVQATLVPRRPRPLRPRDDGALVIESPPVLAGALVVAWFLMLVAVAFWSYVAITDFGAITNPGWTLVMTLGALGSLPDLVRLVTGRLHRWRLVAADDGVHYRGYRSDWHLPWAKVASVGLQDRPAGVRVGTRGTETDRVVPIACFDVPPEQVIEVLTKQRERFGRGKR